MKKTILLAAFGVAGLVGAKDFSFEKNAKISKAVKEQKKARIKECGVVITYWVGGQIVGQQTVTSDQPNLESCQKWQNAVKTVLRIKGFWIVD